MQGRMQGAASQIKRTRRPLLTPSELSFPAVSPDFVLLGLFLFHFESRQLTAKSFRGKRACIAGVIRSPSSASTFRCRAASRPRAPIEIARRRPSSFTFSTTHLIMSKLSKSLKKLINAPAARPSCVPAPTNIASVYGKIQQTAKAKNISQPSWLALSVNNHELP